MSDAAKIIELSKGQTPMSIQLTSHERLEIENLRLKMTLLGRKILDLKGEQQGLVARQKELSGEVSERLGVDVRRYEISTDTGTGRLIEKRNDED